MPEVQTTGEAGQVIKAMIAVQAALKPLRANADSHHGKFANLQQVMQTLQKPLEENKLAVIQLPESSGTGLCSLRTRVIHEDRSEISSVITIPVQRDRDPQAYGAALSYARRYALLCIFGMVTEDDNGDSSSTSLEKLLREMVNCATTEELQKLREEHFSKGLLTDKLWNRVWNIVYDKMYDARSGMNQK